MKCAPLQVLLLFFLASGREKTLNPSMPCQNSSSARSGQTRRQFLKKTGATTLAVAGAGLLEFPFTACGAQNEPSVALQFDPADPLTQAAQEQMFRPSSLPKPNPVEWAVRQLGEALAARHLPLQFHPSLDAVASRQTVILVAGRTSLLARQVLEAAHLALPDSPEGLALARGKAQNRSVILAAGSDARGLVYALLELADRVNFAADPLRAETGRRSANGRPMPSAAFPAFSPATWRTKPGFTTANSGRLTSTMLAANRFNRFNLALGLGYDAPDAACATPIFISRIHSCWPCPATTCAPCRCPTPSAT